MPATPSGTSITKPSAQEALAIVCDGIGGHEGAIASNLAIETIQQQFNKCWMTQFRPHKPDQQFRRLYPANDRISQRNDNEQRHGRQRMGTTLVMAQLMLTKSTLPIGDSRAHWITRTRHQITLDDDVASREVRLGYALIAMPLQHASSGSGSGAGMSSSPNKRFVLDEDCVFLPCSDGQRL